MCFVMLDAPEHSSSKRLETIVFHEPSSRPATFGSKLRLPDATFDKRSPGLTVFEPRVHCFPSLSPTQDPAENQEVRISHKQTS